MNNSNKRFLVVLAFFLHCVVKFKKLVNYVLVEDLHVMIEITAKVILGGTYQQYYM